MAVLWIDDLSGTLNQSDTPDKQKVNDYNILVNVSQEYSGALTHRLGTDLFVPRIGASNSVKGLHMFEKEDGTFYFHAVHDGILYVLNETTDAWDSQENAAGTGLATGSTVEFTNYNGRHYWIGSASTEYLKWSTNTGASTYAKGVSGTVASGSTASTLIASTEIFSSKMVGLKVFNTTDGTSRTITAYTSATTVTVDTAINDTWDGDSIEVRVEGKYLTSNGTYMLISGGSTFPRRSYWTNEESETIDFQADYLSTIGAPTGCASFGNNRPFIIFTRNRYTILDPESGQNNEVDGFGCVSHRSIANLQGSIIWFSGKHFYMMTHTESYPTELSLPIKNDATGDAIMNKIASGNYSVLCAGVSDNKYYCVLRDLSAAVKGVTLDDCVVIFDYNTRSIRVDTYTQGSIGTVFAEFVNENNEKDLYAGSIADGSVYKMEVSGLYTDDDGSGATANVTSIIQTKHYSFGKDKQAVEMKNIKNLHFKYKSDGTLTIKYALDGSTTYTTLSTLPATTSGVDWEYKYMAFGIRPSKTISLQIESTANFILYGIGFEVETTGNEGIKPL